MIHSKLFSILVATAAVALGAFMAGCTLEGGEAADLSSQSTELRVSDGPAKAIDITGAPTQANNLVPRPMQIAPVVKEDHLLGGGNDEGPRPHPWVPAPEDSTETTTDPGGTSTSDNKPSK